MLVEHYFHDAITEPIPVVDTSHLEKEQPNKRPAYRTLKGLSRAALTGSVFIGISAGAVTIGAGGMLALVNAPSFAENEEAAQARTPINNEVSTLISDLSGMDLRVDCNDTRIDESSPEITPEYNYKTYGQVRPYYLVIADISPPVMTVRESVCDSVVSYNPELLASDVNSEAYHDQYYEALDYTRNIGILLHEAEHNNQVHDEDAATCYSYQKLPGALEELGMSPRVAARLAHASSVDSASRMLPEYLSEECTRGGELDLDISDVYIGDTLPSKTQDKTIGSLIKETDPKN